MPTTISSDGVAVDYLRLTGPVGDGTSPRLLMVHATGFCATAWRPLAAALEGRFECWALDVRAHGRSTVPASMSFAWSGTADDVLATVDAIDAASEGGSGWVGVGHSMGGAALLLAEQGRPGTFAGLWIFEPIVFPDTPASAGTDPGELLAAGATRRRASFASRQEAFDNYSAKPPMAAFDRDALAGYLERGLVDEADGSVSLACRPANEAEFYRMGGRHDGWAHLGEVSCPVTVVAGTTDAPGPAGVAAAIADRLPVGVFESHPDLGHFGPMEAPVRMAASVAAALGGTGSASLSPLAPTITP